MAELAATAGVCYHVSVMGIRFSSERLLTLRKLLTHRLAVAGTATSVFSPADVPSAAKPFVALSF